MTACLCTWLFLLKLCQRWVNYYVVLSIAIFNMSKIAGVRG
nr:MAG TPA: hypothetical protein [Caudoviricetes sp.]